MWELNFRYDKTYKKFGNILAVDFDNYGKYILVSTTKGYICAWDTNAMWRHCQVRVINPFTN